MQSNSRYLLIAGMVAVALCLSGCNAAGPESRLPSTQTMQDVHIEFAAKAHGVAVRCGTLINGLGVTNATAELRDLRFYVSDVALINDAGRAVPLQLTPGGWQTQDVVLIDLANDAGACAQGSAATNTRLTGQVPPGRYQGLRFIVGVPHMLNHSNVVSAARPLDVQAMAWSWQAGRKFLQLEVNPVGGVARTTGKATTGRTFQLHLGASGCKGNPVNGETVSCERPNRMDVLINDFNPERQHMVLDLAKLYVGTNLQEDGGGALGCMSSTTDPECVTIFRALGVILSTGQRGGDSQTVFRAEAL